MSTAGLDFDLGEERLLLRDEVRRYAEEQIRPGAAQRDQSKEFPREPLAGLAEMGILGMLVPERYGGAELDVSVVRQEAASDGGSLHPFQLTLQSVRRTSNRLSARFSTSRESCDKAITGMSSSFARALRPMVISVSSWVRFSFLLPRMSCR